ncbi:oxidoreductase, partial [Listeria monocytogenes]|nr:oxidoreductase [Listeria monocytogenes]
MFFQLESDKMNPFLKNKTVLITGASNGLG